MPVMETYGRIRPVRPLGLARGVPSSDTAEAGDSSRVFCHILFIFENFGGAARDGFPSVRGTFAKGLGRVHRSHEPFSGIVRVMRARTTSTSLMRRFPIPPLRGLAVIGACYKTHSVSSRH